MPPDNNGIAAPNFDPASVAQISMLSPSVLARLHDLAAESSGSILEVGPYLGGSTVALASTGRPVVTIEVGGVNTNPYLPSDDVLADLERNLTRFGVADRVTIIPDWASRAYDRLPEVLTEPIGLLFIDADGDLGYHLSRLAPHLGEHCALVFDDYADPDKGPTVQKYVDAAVQAGAVAEDYIDAGMTWFGRLRNAAALPYWPYSPEIALSWYVEVSLGDADTMASQAHSQIQLYEDGRALGPPHSAHNEIRELGGGRFSHWFNGDREGFYFSSSDGSDPNMNGRAYTVCVQGRQLPLAPPRPLG